MAGRKRITATSYPAARLRKNVAKNLEALRAKYDQPASCFAFRIGLAPTQYKRVIDGVASLSIENVVMVSEKTGCNILWLIGMNDRGDWDKGLVPFVNQRSAGADSKARNSD